MKKILILFLTIFTLSCNPIGTDRPEGIHPINPSPEERLNRIRAEVNIYLPDYIVVDRAEWEECQDKN